MTLKLALPKGSLQRHTAGFLERAGFSYSDYHEKSRTYRPNSQAFPDLFTKVFHEKDIAIQVATGNYDMAICGLDWIQETLVRYHRDALVKIRDLGYGQRSLYAVTGRSSDLRSLSDLRAWPGPVRIIGEYPHLAEAFALKIRLRNFRILRAWGAADAYPPEHAEVAILPAESVEELDSEDLLPIAKILSGNAWLIAN